MKPRDLQGIIHSDPEIMGGKRVQVIAVIAAGRFKRLELV